MAQEDIPELDSKGLRQFGLILGGVLALVFGCLLPWSWELEQQPNVWWIGAGIAAAIWALLAPDSLRGFYMRWMRVAMAIGHVVNTLILAIVYFIVITPMALVMRLMGKDPMARALDRQAVSYRVLSTVADKKHVERPY